MISLLLGIILALLPAYLWRLKIFNFPTTFLEILIVVFLFSALVGILKNPQLAKAKISQLGKLNYAIGLFLLASVLATVISPEPMRALGQLKAFIIEPVLVFYASILTIKKSNLKFLLTCLFVSASLISLFGIIQYLTHLGLPLRFWGSGEEPKRIVSVFEYPNALALYLTPLLGFFLVLWRKRYEFIKPIYLYPGMVFVAIALILTFSRGAWLAVIFGVLFPVLLKRDAKRLMAVALTLIILLAFVPSIQQRFTLNDASTVAHKELFVASTNKLIESPLLGNGLYGFRSTLEQQNFPGEVLNYPHNIILNFWLEMGLLGLLAFIWIVYLALYQYKKQPSAISLAVVVYLSVMFLHGLVDVPYFKNDLSVLFWFMISLSYLED